MRQNSIAVMEDELAAIFLKAHFSFAAQKQLLPAFLHTGRVSRSRQKIN
jgi:hypothetical protein